MVVVVVVDHWWWWQGLAKSLPSLQLTHLIELEEPQLIPHLDSLEKVPMRRQHPEEHMVIDFSYPAPLYIHKLTNLCVLHHGGGLDQVDYEGAPGGILVHRIAHGNVDVGIERPIRPSGTDTQRVSETFKFNSRQSRHLTEPGARQWVYGQIVRPKYVIIFPLDDGPNIFRFPLTFPLLFEYHDRSED